MPIEAHLFFRAQDHDATGLLPVIQDGVKERHVGAINDEVVVWMPPDVGDTFDRIKGMELDRAIGADDFQLILRRHLASPLATALGSRADQPGRDG